MNSDPNSELLDDLYPAPGAGPDCDTVLGIVRAHRTARRRRRAAILGLVLAAGSATFFLRDTTPQALPPPAAKSSPQMRHISDDELFDLLDGQPAAIATLPDGTQRLLVIVQR